MSKHSDKIRINLLFIEVTPELADQRLDHIIASLSDLTRSRAQQLISQGNVSITNEGRRNLPNAIKDGITLDKNLRLKEGVKIQIIIPPITDSVPKAQPIPLTIVYEDEHLLVIDKAAGLVVHPGAGNHDNTLVNALLHHCADSLSGIGGVRRPGIVHRLDKETSGLMVVAKHDEAHLKLSELFISRSLVRRYHGICWRVPSPEAGELEFNIGRSRHNRQKMAVVSQGKSAITRYKVLQPLPPYAAIVEFRLLTGRTHQIRVHFSHIGHSLVGDALYGSAPRALAESLRTALEAWASKWGSERHALHSASLSFVHPITKQRLEFQSPWPADLQDLKSVF